MQIHLAVVLLAAGIAAGADADWADLQELHGKRVTVHFADGRKLSGSLLRQADGSVSLAESARTVPLLQAEVTRVTRRSRLRAALLGGAIGFGIAAPVGAYVGPYVTDWGNPSATVRLRHAAGWGLFFGGISAGIGAAVGTQVTVYRR